VALLHPRPVTRLTAALPHFPPVRPTALNGNPIFNFLTHTYFYFNKCILNTFHTAPQSLHTSMQKLKTKMTGFVAGLTYALLRVLDIPYSEFGKCPNLGIGLNFCR